jgi:hypothetical protein
MPENTTATTTSQIILPGLEDSIKAIMTPIVSANNSQIAATSVTISNSLVTSANKEASPVISRNNTEVSPYPTFAIWTNQDNSKAGYTIVNSDFQMIASNAVPGYLSGSTTPTLSNMPNWYEDFRSYTYTNGNIGTSTTTTYYGGSSVWGSADGHLLYRPCLHGGFSGNWFNRADQYGQYSNRCGTIIGVLGVRQRVSHYTTDAEFQVRPRGAVNGYYDRVSLNNAAYATWAGRTNRGMSSYNDRTKMLAVVESTTANAIRLHVWRNTDFSLNDFGHKPGTLHRFLSQAKTAGPTTGNQLSTNKNYAFYDFTWAQTGSTRNEPSYHMKIVMGDNGVVGFGRFNHDGYAQRYGHFTPLSQGTAGTSGIGTFTDTEINLGNTTSYGIDQDENWYGQKHQITWDNQWVAIYSPYHYYSNGMNCHVVNTQDPTKLFYFRNTDGSNGTAIVPFKEDKFVTLYSVNNGDSTGPYLYVVDPGSAAKNLRRTDGTTLSFGGDLQPYNVATYYQFDTHSSTTQYAHIVSMPHWSNP